jgi:hypothetical protein
MAIGSRDSFTSIQMNGGGGAVGDPSPPSLSKFLTDNREDTNQNRKFPSSSPTSSVFGRLGFNFDPADDNVLLLSDAAKKHLESIPRLLKDWQAEDMRNGNVGNYYKNPLNDVLVSINSALEQIKSKILVASVTTFDYEAGFAVTSNTYVTNLEEVFNQANFALDEGEKFLRHTNRLSNVEKPQGPTETANSIADFPHFDDVMSLGRVLLYICYQTDGIMNTAPIIGSMTSLFTDQELGTYNTTIAPYPGLIANSITIESVMSGESQVAVYTSNLSSNVITTITDTIKGLKILFETRRTHDENFWIKSQAVIDEFEGFDSLNNGGEFQNFMVNNFVGTEKLLQSANTPDNPKPFEEQVIVSPNGFVTVYNKKTGKVISSDEDLENIVLNAEPTDTLIQTVFDQGTPPTANDVTPGESTSPILTLDEYIEKYNLETLTVTVGDSTLNVNTGAIIFNTLNGVWSGTRIIQVTNISDNVYYYSNAESVSNFLNSEVDVIVDDSTKRLGIKSVTIANTGTGYSNGVVVITGGGTDNIAATIRANVNSITGAITTVNITSRGAYTSVPTLNVQALGGSSASLIAVLDDPTNSISNGESFNVSVQFRSLTTGNTVDYGLITINPGIEIRVKGYSNVSTAGILLPGDISQNVGNSTNRPMINEFNGPYAIVDPAATGTEKWTFRNLSANSLNIVSVIETTNSLSTNSNTHMNVQLYQASTPNVINVNDSVLWYANVKPLVEFPNVSTFLVTTEDGQQRTITIGIDRGLVDDSNLYNEIVNSNPDIIVTNSPFDIRVFGAKPNTAYTYSGPNISGTGFVLPNGYSLIANTTITNTGSYTYTINFDGTNHRRTLTKVITS